MFSLNGPMARHVYSSVAIGQDKHSHQILLNNQDQQVLSVSCCARGARSAMYNCVVFVLQIVHRLR